MKCQHKSAKLYTTAELDYSAERLFAGELNEGEDASVVALTSLAGDDASLGRAALVGELGLVEGGTVITAGHDESAVAVRDALANVEGSGLAALGAGRVVADSLLDLGVILNLAVGDHEGRHGRNGGGGGDNHSDDLHN